MDIEQGTYHQLYLDTLSLSELAAISDKLRDEVIDLGRRTVEKSWELGGVLLAAKDQVDHGDWMPWLADRLISHDIAKRLMNLHAGYPQKVKIALFDSVNVALKRLPAKTDPERIATQRPPATATKGEVIEMVEAEAMPAKPMRALVRDKIESYLEPGALVVARYSRRKRAGIDGRNSQFDRL